MSLAIQLDDVVSVLLTDGWHEVADAFTIDSYEYLDGLDDGYIVHGGGQGGICSSGFRFLEQSDRGTYLAGPLTAIQAVRTT